MFRSWSEFDSFVRVEDAGGLKNWWGNDLSPDKRTAFANEDETGRSRRQV